MPLSDRSTGEDQGVALQMKELIERDLKMAAKLLQLIKRNGLFSAYTAVGAVVAYVQQFRNLVYWR